MSICKMLLTAELLRSTRSTLLIVPLFALSKPLFSLWVSRTEALLIGVHYKKHSINVL